MIVQDGKAETEISIAETTGPLTEQQFRKLISRLQKTVTKVRRIDLAELLEFAWVEGMLEPFAERLIRSRPDLKEDIETITHELRTAD